MRTGLWVSGAGGSGILVGRKPDGNWSQPVGIMLHTAGLGYLVGVDIYDCVLVLNTEEAVRAFAKWRCTVGGEVSAVAGPVGMGGIVETEVHKRQAPVLTYLKSRGFYAGVQIDGTVVIERSDENERFYGERIPARDILGGKAQSRLFELRILMETLKAAQGDRNVDKSLIPTDPPPADYQVVEDGHTFGIPDREDPDPYGVLALEKEGLAIKEAGTKRPASTEQFDFKPSMTSPIYDNFRRSHDSMSRRSSWRSSALSSTTKKERSHTMSDVSTQTDFEPSSTPSPQMLQMEDQEASNLPNRGTQTYHQGSWSSGTGSPTKLREVPESEEDRAQQKTGDDEKDGVSRRDPSPQATAGQTSEEQEHEEPVVVQTIRQAPQVVTKARMVNVPKRVPPKLPERNPGRARAVQVNGHRSSNASTPTSAVTPASDSGAMSPERTPGDYFGHKSNGHRDSANETASIKSNERPPSIRSTESGEISEAKVAKAMAMNEKRSKSESLDVLSAAEGEQARIVSSEQSASGSSAKVVSVKPAHQVNNNASDKHSRSSSPPPAPQSYSQQEHDTTKITILPNTTYSRQAKAIPQLQPQSLEPPPPKTTMDSEPVPGGFPSPSPGLEEPTPPLAPPPRNEKRRSPAGGPRVSMANIRGGLHDEASRSPSRSRSVSPVKDKEDDFS